MKRHRSAGVVSVLIAVVLTLAGSASAATPGTIVKAEPSKVSALGLPLNVKAWKLTYASTDTDGNPVNDKATVLLPNKPASTSPRPLLSYQTAEDSLGEHCAPSNRLPQGIERETPRILAGLEQGWAVVVPDYEGPESQWTAGIQAGHGVLDAIRAARTFVPLGVDPTSPIGLWGYSGGGQASAWAAELQPDYAPELELAGVAEGGVPRNVAEVARQINGGPAAGLYFGAAIGLSRAYPQYIDRNALLSSLGQRYFSLYENACLEQIVTQGAFQRMETYTRGNIDPLTLPNIQKVVELNELGHRRPTGPLFVLHSANDDLIPVAGVDELVRTYCSEGVPVHYVKDVLSEHSSLAVSGTAAAIDYLQDRFAGKPAPDNCATGPETKLSTLASTRELITTLTSVAGLAGFL
jgi:pimeloyl-ACP methyl ester carboxylesterase